jgi:pimeloyl-ACP methyl ester carboxylesterase
VPSVLLAGIDTAYAVEGAGPPLLMFSPGGFGATMGSWRTQGLYARLDLLDRLSAHFTCITFDKRESGRSGGRVEPLTWAAYAEQGLLLLAHLGYEQAHFMGGCVGCSIVTTAATLRRDVVRSMVLYSPAGGARYRITQQERLATHLAYVEEVGLAGVVAEARRTEATFSADPRLGPWVTVLRHDDRLAEQYAGLDLSGYRRTVRETASNLFGSDAVPGPAAEALLALDVPALVVPGQDSSHATSAARWLEECLPEAQYWDVPVDEQTASTAPARLVEFLTGA